MSKFSSVQELEDFFGIERSELHECVSANLPLMASLSAYYARHVYEIQGSTVTSSRVWARLRQAVQDAIMDSVHTETSSFACDYIYREIDTYVCDTYV